MALVLCVMFQLSIRITFHALSRFSERVLSLGVASLLLGQGFAVRGELHLEVLPRCLALLQLRAHARQLRVQPTQLKRSRERKADFRSHKITVLHISRTAVQVDANPSVKTDQANESWYLLICFRCSVQSITLSAVESASQG